MARFKIIAGGQSRIYDILDDSLTAGSAAGNAIRIQQDGVAGVHVRVWRASDGVWIAAVDAASVRVNGEPVTRHRLRHGDRIEFAAGCALEFVDPAEARADPKPARPAPARAPEPERRAAPASRSARLVVPSSRREALERRGQRERRQARRRPEPGPRWHLFSGLLLLSAAVVWIGVRVLSGSVGVKSAEDLFALAQSQLERGNPQLALQTAQGAASRAEASEDLRRRIAAFVAKIEAMSRAAVDAPLLDLARQGLANQRTFEKNWLGATPPPRPASREFVRLADTWQTRYAEVCERHPDARPMIAEVAELRARYVAAAQLDQPDDAEDVLFLVRRTTRLQRPRWREAVAALDAFLARGGDPAALERVRACRDEVVDKARAWFERTLDQLRREWDRGRLDAVLSEAELLLAEHVLDEQRAELEAQVRRWRQEAGR